MKWSWVLLLAAVGLVAVLLTVDGPAPGTGTFPVEVVGPDGVIVAANVTLEDATVYRVLAAALQDAGIDHTVTGAGESLFVTTIDGHQNEGAAGWCFDVWDQGWIRPALGAGTYGLAPGQASRWLYEPEGCGRLN